MSGQQSGPGAGDRLHAAMAVHGPLCAGIDPHPQLLEAWGLSDDVTGLEAFAETVVAAAAGTVASIKPQIALFERHGAAGLGVAERVLAQARAAGVLVLADAKRGDIGSTMAAYADAWLGQQSPLAADAVTLSPYLGFESLRPALDLAAQNHRGTFVLALTSNPEGASVQHVGGSASVARSVVAAASQENAARTWQHAGPCGLVVGATVGDALTQLGIDLSAFNGLVLTPGYGAQGADEEDLRRTFEGAQDRLVVPASRSVLRHGPREQVLREVMADSNGRLRESLSR